MSERFPDEVLQRAHVAYGPEPPLHTLRALYQSRQQEARLREALEQIAAIPAITQPHAAFDALNIAREALREDRR